MVDHRGSDTVVPGEEGAVALTLRAVNLGFSLAGGLLFLQDSRYRRAQA